MSNLSGATTPSQSGPESEGNEGVLQIPRISKSRASPSDGLMSYPGHSLGEGLTPLQTCSRCILQRQLTGLGGGGGERAVKRKGRRTKRRGERRRAKQQQKKRGCVGREE